MEIDAGGRPRDRARARGTPRVANRLLRRVRDFAQVKGRRRDHARGRARRRCSCSTSTIFGLDDMDARILKTIIEKFDGGPVGLEHDRRGDRRGRRTRSRKCTSRSSCSTASCSARRAGAWRRPRLSALRLHAARRRAGRRRCSRTRHADRRARESHLRLRFRPSAGADRAAAAGAARCVASHGRRSRDGRDRAPDLRRHASS